MIRKIKDKKKRRRKLGDDMTVMKKKQNEKKFGVLFGLLRCVISWCKINDSSCIVGARGMYY